MPRIVPRPLRRRGLRLTLPLVLVVGWGITTGGVLAQPPDTVPPLDTSTSNVPLDRVYFNTFDPATGIVQLSDADASLIGRLRDAIPPLHNPQYEPASAADWLRDDDIIIGYHTRDQAWAYPVSILNYHEIVNDVLAGTPVLVSYCPLCRTGAVYSRTVGGRVLSFGNSSALYESNLVMVDYQTGSYWWQVAGRGIIGPLAGTVLDLLPGITTTWEQWRDEMPSTRVLSRQTGHHIDYTVNPFTGYAERVEREEFVSPVSRRRYRRLDPETMVLVVGRDDQVHAYPIDEDVAIVHDRVGDTPVVVFMDGQGGARAFSASLDDTRISFDVDGDVIRDEGSGSVWNTAGRSIEGDLAGRVLSRLPSKTSFWFAVVASTPDITLRGR